MTGRRIAGRGVAASAAAVPFTFARETLAGLEGETIAAALVANGKLRPGAALFCGMGVCGACLVTVDGRTSQRACMTALSAGMVVEAQGDRVAAAAVASAPRDDPAVDAPEILVVGGGPAGLAAARAALLCGAGVTLIDERPELGGQYYKQLATAHRFTNALGGDRQYRAGRALLAEVEGLGARILRGVRLWGAFAPDELAASGPGGEAIRFRPRRAILATGASERGVPLPGWTLPGFMTTGAAQTLLRAYRVRPGERVVIAGNGPLNFQLAAELVQAGAPPVAVLEAAPRPWPTAAFRAAARDPRLMLEGARYMARLRASGVPIHWRTAVIAASGGDRVEEVVTARLDPAGNLVPGSERRLAADAVCFNWGFVPATALGLGLGCAHVRDPAQACLIPERDDDGRTSLPNVFAVGDGAEIGGAQAALEQGFIAGVAAARDLGRAVPPEVADELARRRRRLARHRAFQAALWALFEAPPMLGRLADEDTVICRCEGVTAGALHRAVVAGATSPALAKRRTRAGMGWCQGRLCMPVIAAMTASEDSIAPRPPVMPVRLGELAVRATLDAGS